MQFLFPYIYVNSIVEEIRSHGPGVYRIVKHRQDMLRGTTIIRIKVVHNVSVCSTCPKDAHLCNGLSRLVALWQKTIGRRKQGRHLTVEHELRAVQDEPRQFLDIVMNALIALQLQVSTCDGWPTTELHTRVRILVALTTESSPMCSTGSNPGFQHIGHDR